MVGAVGLEPTRACTQTGLNRLRRPIAPRPHAIQDHRARDITSLVRWEHIIETATIHGGSGAHCLCPTLPDSYPQKLGAEGGTRTRTSEDTCS
jgi:hypothetical protein